MTEPVAQPVDSGDLADVEAQLGRPSRGMRAVGHRCPCGLPDVVVTDPRLPDGTPFPTTYYLTCPRATSLIGTLEGSGLMREMEARLHDDPDLAAAYRAAHDAYLADRQALGDVPEIEGVSAGRTSLATVFIVAAAVIYDWRIAVIVGFLTMATVEIARGDDGRTLISTFRRASDIALEKGCIEAAAGLEDMARAFENY